MTARVMQQPGRVLAQAYELAWAAPWLARIAMHPANGSYPHAAQVVLAALAHPNPAIPAASPRIRPHYPAIISRIFFSLRARLLGDKQQPLQNKIILNAQRLSLIHISEPTRPY